ncbi:MAG: dihydropteroate synthase, partial [Verrucomicrobia bacterium]|nr:dihydropteroate synthase [Verrucomicrobiota bacterium]
MIWRCRNSTLDFSDGRPRVMGVLNVTPDSFSDGGKFLDLQAAVAHAHAMIEAGADIIDIGGESSRPGSAPVLLEEELRRVVPVVEQLNAQRPLLSVDTTKAEVARRALDAGAHIINDISAGRFDADMLPLATRTGAGVVLIHMQGTPQTMQQAPHYDDVTREVADFLRERMAAAQAAGIAPEQVVVDPGIGFGKSVKHNLDLLAHLDALNSFGRPVLVGLSRKSFIGKLLGEEVADRLAGSLAAACWAVLRGANIVRVHDVAETVAALRVIDELRQQSGPGLRHGNKGGPHVPC